MTVQAYWAYYWYSARRHQCPEDLFSQQSQCPCAASQLAGWPPSKTVYERTKPVDDVHCKAPSIQKQQLRTLMDSGRNGRRLHWKELNGSRRSPLFSQEAFNPYLKFSISSLSSDLSRRIRFTHFSEKSNIACSRSRPLALFISPPREAGTWPMFACMSAGTYETRFWQSSYHQTASHGAWYAPEECCCEAVLWRAITV